MLQKQFIDFKIINNMMKNKKLIHSLIKDNLIHNKLILGLSELGLDAGHYHLHLNETILKLSGIKTDSDNLDPYLDLYEDVMQIDIEDAKQLNKLTDKIYSHLMQLKNNG